MHIGFIMMHHGVKNLFNKNIKKEETKKEFKKTMIISLLYTILILVLIYFGVLEFHQEFINKLMN